MERYTPLAAKFGPEGKHFVSGIFFILGDAAKLQRAGGAQRPVWRVNEPKKTGARSARARTRGQNPLVSIIYLSRVLCLCVTVAERSAILYVLVIKLTKETRRR